MLRDERYVYGDQNVQVPAHLNYGKFMLDRLRRMEDEVALENADTGEKLTYKEFTQYAVDLSVSLTKLGVGKGDVVALGTEKCKMFFPTALAIVFTGASFTSFYLDCGRAVLKHQMTMSHTKILLCSKLFWERYSEVLKTCDSIKMIITLDDDLASAVSVKSLISNHVDVEKFEPATVEGQIDTAIVFYSSGTTDMPKAVQLTHLNCILNSLTDNKVNNDSMKTIFNFGNWYFGYDFFTTSIFLHIGKKVVYLTANESTPESLLSYLELYQVNIAFLKPFTIHSLCKTDGIEKFNLDSLDIVYTSGDPLHIKTIEKLRERFPSIKHVLQGYAMTEAGLVTSENSYQQCSKPGSVGKACPGVTLKVMHTETREILGPNQRGQICIKGPMLMKGYIGVDPSTYLDDQGFFRTGDLGYYDEEGHFYIVERLTEVMKFRTFQVPPLELETILLQHPGVLDAGVVGRPVPEDGEEPTAFVVRQPGSAVTEQELVDYVAPEVTPYMQLRGGVRFVSEIPKGNGKILRRRLREMLNE